MASVNFIDLQTTLELEASKRLKLLNFVRSAGSVLNVVLLWSWDETTLEELGRAILHYKGGWISLQRVFFQWLYPKLESSTFFGFLPYNSCRQQCDRLWN